MNFGFDEDQKSLGETVGQVLADFPALIAPDPEQARDEAAWSALAELGLFALTVPERFDGVGLTPVDVALAVEAMGRGLAPLSAASALIVTDLLVRHGTDRQQRELLPRIATGEAKVAIAVLEHDAGYDAAALATRVDRGQLSGGKILVADAADAEVILVVAIDAGEPRLVLVKRSADGVVVARHTDIDPSAGMCAVTFDDVALGPDAVLGASAPQRAVERLVDVAATVHAGLLIGIAGRMMDTAVEYARTREQFGQAIGAFQAIKHRCADMAVAVEAGRSAAYYAFWAVSEDAADRARAASMAKAYCSEIARDVCNEAIQVHGGMGFTWELGLHRFLRRAKLIEHLHGDSAWHNERILTETLAAMRAGTTADERPRDAA
jgi:alkylation response protein AidB-like acyl-CoA dehydrogenase